MSSFCREDLLSTTAVTNAPPSPKLNSGIKLDFKQPIIRFFLTNNLTVLSLWNYQRTSISTNILNFKKYVRTDGSGLQIVLRAVCNIQHFAHPQHQETDSFSRPMVIFFLRQVVSCFKSCHQAEDAHEWPFPGPDLYCTPALSNRLCVLRSVSRQSHQSIVSSTNRIDDISSLYKIMDRRERGGHLLQHDITLSCVLLFFFFFSPACTAFPLLFLPLASLTNHSPKLHSMAPLWMMTRHREDLGLRTALIMEKTHRAMH